MVPVASWPLRAAGRRPAAAQALRAVSRDGVGRIIDWAARRAATAKLSLHLGSLTELLHEADYFARGGSGIIDAGHVQHAVDARNLAHRPAP